MTLTVAVVVLFFGALVVLVVVIWRLFPPESAAEPVAPPVREEAPVHEEPPPPPVVDPGAQALAILRRGENCNWYSIEHTNEQHEAFDCLEIYWRTKVEHPERNELHYGRGPFELKAGFRVRWHVAATHHSYVEACGIDLLTTILEARELADRLTARSKILEELGYEHPALEVWKAKGPERKYSFHGLDIEKWNVRLEYPGGLAWAEHAELRLAVADALAKAPP